MIDRNTIISYLNFSLGDPKYTAQGIKYNCPKSGCDTGDKYNLEIDVERKIFNCWACRYGGSLHVLLNDYAKDNSWRNLQDFKFKSAVNNEVKKINYPHATTKFSHSKEVSDYLINVRKIDRSILVKRNVQYVYSENEFYYNNIYFPFYEEGRQVGACVQDMSTKKYRNLGPLNFVPYKEFIDNDYPIVIGEGIYDILPTHNGIPLLGIDITDPVLRFINDKNVILALDNKIDIDHYIKQLKKIECANVKGLSIFDLFDNEDLNSFYVKDKAGFYSQLKKCFEELK